MNHISIGTISSSAQIWDPKMYESRKVFWEKWPECMRSVWTVFVTRTALVYESCKILREKWSLVTWILFVQLFQGRFLLFWVVVRYPVGKKKALTVVDMKFLNVFKCFSVPFSYKSRHYLYSHYLNCSVAVGLGVRCMLLSNGEGPWSGKFLAVQACKPICTLNIEHPNIWTRYVESVTFIFKNKNNFIFHISLRKCIPFVFWKYLLRILAW